MVAKQSLRRESGRCRLPRTVLGLNGCRNKADEDKECQVERNDAGSGGIEKVLLVIHSDGEIIQRPCPVLAGEMGFISACERVALIATQPKIDVGVSMQSV